MGSIGNFLGHMDWTRLLMTLLSAASALICLTIHELSHGAVAYRLGDPTAKNAGRLTLNPIRHIDWLGLLLMVTVRVGWAKPVPVDPRYFKKPKRGMALTALAGPVSNFLLAWVFLLLASLAFRGVNALSWFLPGWAFTALTWLVVFLSNAAVLSVGLGVFNLIPIPPLDGSKVLFSFFPDRIYAAILRYERYIMVLVFLAVWTGVLDRPLSFCILGALRGLCFLSGFPYDVLMSLFY